MIEDRREATWSPWLVLGAIGAGFLGALVGITIVGLDPDTTALFLVVVPAQLGAQLAFVVIVSRSLGSGSLAQDFLILRVPRVVSAFFIGVGAQVGFLVVNAVIVELLDSDGVAQGIVAETEEAASSWVMLFVVVAIGVVAPIIEEMMFRGLMLRPLLRRRSTEFAVLATAAAFAATHILDVDVGQVFSWVVIAELFVLGVVLGRLAVRDGSIARPIALHMGFNTLPLVLLYIATFAEA